jgi:E3 ubiquitin-protein ligase Topors
VASNRYTGYVPHPTPTQISASVELQRRARAFLRRELRVWINLDIEFLTNYIIALIKTVDLRSEAGIKLLADLMDPGNPYLEETRKPNTEHLAHGKY